MLIALSDYDGDRDVEKGLWEKEGEEGDEEANEWLRSWKQIWFQQLPKRRNVFCFVDYFWQHVPEGGCSTVEMTLDPVALLSLHWEEGPNTCKVQNNVI